MANHSAEELQTRVMVAAGAPLHDYDKPEGSLQMNRYCKEAEEFQDRPQRQIIGPSRYYFTINSFD